MISLTLIFISSFCQSQWFVDTLHVGDGAVLNNVVVAFDNGRLSQISPNSARSDDFEYVADAHMTPGLIDAYSYMGVEGNTLEESRESTASIHLSDSLIFDSPAFSFALAEGVTTAYLSPASRNVIGGLGCLVKTTGGQPASLFSNNVVAELIEDAAALKITLGGDPSYGNTTGSGKWTTTYRARRPTTRMGTVWVVRREFYRAVEYRDLRERGQVPFNPDLEVLTRALSGDLLVRVQARESHDVETALRLQEEFGWPRMIIEEATGSHKISKMIARKGVSMVTGPAFDSAARSIARGPSSAELRLAAMPGQICCEDLHNPDEEHDEEHDGEHSHVDKESGRLALNPFVLDLLPLVAPRYDAAPGLSRGRRSEAASTTPALPALLSDNGVRFAMGSAEAHDEPLTESSLIYQIRRAVHWGLDSKQALAFITSIPAQLCGIDDKLGFLKEGYDADFVLWSGDPLESTSVPLVVAVNGEVVIDNR
jgi:imidazolonepropionase-like amidohydrolase